MQQHNPKLKPVELLESEPPDPAAEPAPDSNAVWDLQKVLEERLLRPPELAETLEPAVLESPAPEQLPTAKSKLPIRLVKVLLGLAVVALFGWVPLRALLQTSSVEAIVNSRIVTVRAPIEGEVLAAPGGLSGTAVLAQNQPLLRIQNVRADRSRLDALNDQLGGLEIEKSTFDAKIAALKRSHDALEEEVARFTLGRIRQLEARTAGLASSVAVAQAKREVAQSAAIRAVELSHTNTVSPAELERLQRDETIATQTAVGAERELDAANVELEAARSGSFIGDSYNDIPSSAQRRDQLSERLDELAADRDSAVAQIGRLRAALVAESTHYQALSDVVVSLPVSGRIWEVMTAPGEHVQVGQDLLKILDCSGAVVTANVTESVYNQLRIGSPARFRPTDGGADLEGVVTNLTGLADAPANLAILPSALSREAYRVTVSVPQLASEQGCAIGRTGRVIFDRAPADAR